MDERIRRTVTWVALGCLAAIIVVFAVARKTELDRMADALANGSPAEQMAAMERLVKKQKVLEGLEERPRWVQDRAALAVARLSTFDAFWECAAAEGVADDPPNARLTLAIKQEGEVTLDLMVEGIQDKDGTRRGSFAGPLGQTGEPALGPLAKLMDAWDQYVRDICRDQLTAIGNKMAADEKAAKDLIALRKRWLAKYEADAARTKAPADLAKVAEQRLKVSEAEGKLAPLPSTSLVPDMLMAMIEEPQPPEEEKEQVARYLRRVATAKATVVNQKGPSIQAVIDRLVPAESTDVRATGCDLLGQMGNQKYTVTGDVLAAPLAADAARPIVKPLLERLQRDPEWTVRRRACIALGRLQLVAMEEGATAPLIAALGAPQPDVKAAAAQALGMIAAARPFDVAKLTWLETGPNATATAAAQPLAVTLRVNRAGAAGELAVALEKVGSPAIPHLLPALTHPDQEVRLLATQTIARIGTDQAVAPLGQALGDTDVLVRQTAADALRSLSTPAVVPQLVAALGDSDWKVYYGAKDALARLGQRAVPGLVAALANPNAQIQYTAEQALAEIGRASVPALIGGLSSDNPQVLKWVPIALGDIGYDAVVPAAQVLGSPSSKTTARAAAARALGRSGQNEALPPLLKACSDPSPEVKGAVASALVHLGNPGLPGPVVALLRGPDAAARRQAIREKVSAPEDLRAQLDSSDEKTREGAIRRVATTPSLVSLLQDPSPAVRVATMERLTEWYDPPMIPALAKLLTASDQDAQRRAAILLAEHVGGQEELRAAVASATTAGEAHNLGRRAMSEVAKAVDALKRGLGPKSQVLLEGYLKGDNDAARYAAVVAIASLAQEAKSQATRDWALKLLEGNLDAEDPDIEQTAAVAIARSRVPGVLEKAVGANLAPDVLAKTIESLGLLGTSSSVAVLTPLCSRGGATALGAADAIGRIGRRLSEASEGKSPEAAEAAKKLIDLAHAQTDPDLRARLGVAIANIGESAVQPAIDYLQTAPEKDRPFAAAVLGKLGNVAVDPYLLRARGRLRLQTGQENLRNWLSVALYVTGDKMARDLISSLPEDEKPPEDLREAADKQLQSLLDVE